METQSTQNQQLVFRATLFLISVNFLVFLLQPSGEYGELQRLFYHRGLIPKAFLMAFVSGPSYIVAALTTLVTHMFLHANFLHVAGNMLNLFVFGRVLEEWLGSKKFLSLYLLGGMASVLVGVMLSPMQVTPAIGASGAVAILMGAAAVVRPRYALMFLPLYVWLVLPIVEAGIFGAQSGAFMANVVHFSGLVLGALFSAYRLGLLGSHDKPTQS